MTPTWSYQLGISRPSTSLRSAFLSPENSQSAATSAVMFPAMFTHFDLVGVAHERLGEASARAVSHHPPFDAPDVLMQVDEVLVASAAQVRVPSTTLDFAAVKLDLPSRAHRRATVLTLSHGFASSSFLFAEAVQLLGPHSFQLVAERSLAIARAF